MVTEVFLSLLLTSVIGLILAVVRMCYKSKCTKFSCFGISIERDVITEKDLDELAPQSIKNNPSDQV